MILLIIMVGHVQLPTTTKAANCDQTLHHIFMTHFCNIPPLVIFIKLEYHNTSDVINPGTYERGEELNDGTFC